LKKIFFLTILLMSVFILSCKKAKRGETEKWHLPNIIFILADDMGYGDIKELNKDSKIQTPNLDRLVSEGISFNDAHSNSAVCTPTRYGILTGRYCYRSRLKSSVLYGYSKTLIDSGRLTVASLLEEKGYRTACIGKWHLGLDWEKKDPDKPLFIKRDNWEIDLVTNCDFTKPVRSGPNSIGFNYSYILPGSLDMAPYVYVKNHKVTAPVTELLDGVDSERGVFYRQGEMAVDFDIYKTLDHFTDKAVDYVTMNASQAEPFFLYFPLTSPHTPWLPSEQFKGRSGAGVYGDFVMHTDHVVGRIMDALEEAGIAGETIVVFTSDNGSDWRAGDIDKWSHRANYIYAGRKSDVWEGGHHVPFIVRWPGYIQSGTRSDQLVCTSDWLATCAELTGYRLEEDEGEDSYSFLPVLLDQEYDVNYRGAVIHHSLPGEFAIRFEDWKYVDCRGSGGWTSEGNSSDPPGQLYDMITDPGETNNLYEQLPDKTNNLYEQLPDKVNQLKEMLELYKTDPSIQIIKRKVFSERDEIRPG